MLPEEEELKFYDLSALCRLFKSFIVHTGGRKERKKSDTERHGIPPQPPWFFLILCFILITV